MTTSPGRRLHRSFLPAAIAAAALALTTGAGADVVLPSSAYSTGGNFAEFRTDLRIFNPGATPALVVPILYDQATSETVTRPAITVPPRTQVAYDNVNASLFGRGKPSYGPIRLQTSAPLIVSASVNNVNSCGNGATSGMWLPGLEATQGATQGQLVQLALSADGSSGYRTNLVFFNPGTGTANVTARLRKGDGTLLSTLVLDPLEANGWVQKTVGSSFPGASAVTDTNLFVEFTSDQPVLSFASVVNNASGDPFAIVAQLDPQAPPSAGYTVSPAAPAAGQVVTFTDTSTGAPTLQLWDFGDGATATAGTAVTHTYAAAGTFHTAHFVANGSGASGTTKDVNVSGGTGGPVAITIAASQWQYTPSTVTLHVGTTYQLTWQSQDVTHGLGGLAALGITQCDVIARTLPCVVTLTPTAGQVGTYNYQCTQSSCGAGHNSMKGALVIAP